jgi:hypothetical protein
MNTRTGIIVMMVTALWPIAAAAGSPAVAVIYRCQSKEGATFSDRPCGSQAEPYEADTSRVSSYAPGPVPAAKEKPKPSTTRRRTATDKAAANGAQRRAEVCSKIRQGLADIRTAMRTGYTARKGEQLKARKAKLTQRARAERCR